MKKITEEQYLTMIREIKSWYVAGWIDSTMVDEMDKMLFDLIG